MYYSLRFKDFHWDNDIDFLYFMGQKIHFPE